MTQEPKSPLDADPTDSAAVRAAGEAPQGPRPSSGRRVPSTVVGSRQIPPQDQGADSLGDFQLAEDSVEIPPEQAPPPRAPARTPPPSNFHAQMTELIEDPQAPPPRAHRPPSSRFATPVRPRPPSTHNRSDSQLQRSSGSGSHLRQSHGSGIAAPRSPVGSMIGKYLIKSELGRGAMGIVLLGEQPDIGREVALKLLPTQLGQQEKAVNRFYREVKAVARLRHPNIVQLYDYGLENGIHYYAMEYVKGQDLQVLADRERLAFNDLARIGARCAEGLNLAHCQGVIHRDIKPANILIDEKGNPKLSDFGLARLDGQSSMTQDGAILGTPAYMPPEQAMGEQSLNRLADIYSLGATLYELATGEAPYTGDSAREIVIKVIHGPPRDPLSVDPYMPKSLAAIIGKAMARDPKDRYQNAQSLADDLSAFANDETVDIAPLTSFQARERRNTLFFAVFAGLFFLGLVATIAVALRGIGGTRTIVIEDDDDDVTEGPDSPFDARDTDIALRTITERVRRVREDLDAYFRGGDDRERAAELVASARAAFDDDRIIDAENTLIEARAADPSLPELIFLETDIAVAVGDEDRMDLCIDRLTAMMLRSDDFESEERDRARLQRAQVYASYDDKPYDFLAIEDFKGVSGTLSWRARLELLRFYELREYDALALKAGRKLTDSSAEVDAIGNELLTRDQLAEAFLILARILDRRGAPADKIDEALDKALDSVEGEDLRGDIEDFRDEIRGS